MTCKNIEQQISRYLDGELNDGEISAMMEHIENCKACEILFEDMKLIHETMAGMPQMELPENFEAELHEKLLQASAEESESDNEMEHARKVIRIPLPRWQDFKTHYKPLAAVAATLMVAVLVYGAGNFMPRSVQEMAMDSTTEMYEGASEDAFGSEADFEFAEEAPAVEPSAARTLKGGNGLATFDAVVAESDSVSIGTTSQQVTSPVDGTVDVDSRMIIYSANIALDIVEYDEVYERIVIMVNDLGGFVSDANTSYKYYDETDPDSSLKYGRLTIRIPQDRFMGTVDFLETLGVQRNLNIWSQDITSQYRDIANEVANLEIREAKLREIMEKAEEIDDIISVERELSRVRGEINQYMGTLKNWEQLVSLSTIHIDLNEVETLEPKFKPIDKTLLQKARDGFIESINQLKYGAERLFIGSVSLFPLLLVGVIVFFAGYRIVKWLLKRFRK